MTATRLTAQLAPTANTDSCLVGGVERFLRLRSAYLSWRLRNRQRAQLYALSDRTLKDIGVSRWEIEGIVNSPNRDASGRVR